MKKTLSAFTIIEIILVVTIIGVLSTITVTSFSVVQKNSKDSSREAKARIIASALEDYYQKNGEYPGCTTITQSATTVASTLKIDSNNLTSPTATQGSNSIVCTDLSNIENDVFAYVGDTSADCQTGSACSSFSLKYIDQGSNSVKTINSKHIPVDPNLSTGDIADNFDRTGSSLGVTSTGAKPWTALAGTWSTNGSFATTSTSYSSKPTAVVTFGSPNARAWIDIDTISAGTGQNNKSGNDALIVRASNSNNYIRARYVHTSTSTTTTTPLTRTVSRASFCVPSNWTETFNVYTEGWNPGNVIPDENNAQCAGLFPNLGNLYGKVTVVGSTPTECWPGGTSCYLGTRRNRTFSYYAATNTTYNQVTVPAYCNISSWTLSASNVITESNPPSHTIPSNKVSQCTSLATDEWPNVNGNGIAQSVTVVGTTPENCSAVGLPYGIACYSGGKTYTRAVTYHAQETSTSTTTTTIHTHSIVLEKVVNGVATTLATKTATAPIYRINLEVNNSSIKLWINSSENDATTVTDTFNQTATMYGIGRAAGSNTSYTTSAINSFGVRAVFNY